MPPSTDAVQSRKNEFAPGVGSVARLDANSTRRPSAVQPRTKSPLGLYVNRRGSPPIAGTTYTSAFPATMEVYAIQLPSGEKNGFDSTEGVAVIRLAGPPVRGTVQMSPAYSNAIEMLLTLGRRNKRVPVASAEVLELRATTALVRSAMRVEAAGNCWAESGPAESPGIKMLAVEAMPDASRSVARRKQTEVGEIVFKLGFVLCEATRQPGRTKNGIPLLYATGNAA
ncbi:MAG: hypothetical protein ABIZ36_01225 [Gemmatimonadaceae bacterium]